MGEIRAEHNTSTVSADSEAVKIASDSIGQDALLGNEVGKAGTSEQQAPDNVASNDLTSTNTELQFGQENPPNGSALNSTQQIHQSPLEQRQKIALQVLAQVIEQPNLEQACMALSNELQRFFGALRVSVGLVTNSKVKLSAISQQAVIDKSANESRLISLSMQEAIHQDAIISLPHIHTASRTQQLQTTQSQSLNDTSLLHDAHKALLGARSDTLIYTIPLVADQEYFGAVTIETPYYVGHDHQEKTKQAEDAKVYADQQHIVQIGHLITPYLKLHSTGESRHH